MCEPEHERALVEYLPMIPPCQAVNGALALLASTRELAMDMDAATDSKSGTQAFGNELIQRMLALGDPDRAARVAEAYENGEFGELDLPAEMYDADRIQEVAGSTLVDLIACAAIALAIQTANTDGTDTTPEEILQMGIDSFRRHPEAFQKVRREWNDHKKFHSGMNEDGDQNDTLADLDLAEFLAGLDELPTTDEPEQN
jgi:hypothetical protein